MDPDDTLSRDTALGKTDQMVLWRFPRDFWDFGGEYVTLSIPPMVKLWQRNRFPERNFIQSALAGTGHLYRTLGDAEARVAGRTVLGAV
jgi:hypothetical protein